MKAWNHHTWKAKKFFRLNHNKASKRKFFLAYYRILHTAYIKKQDKGIIDTIKKLFLESMDRELDAWSVFYLLNTEKCFADDSITDSLLHDGRIECPDKLRKLLIEIGFDVFLIQSTIAEKKVSRKSFYRWLPMRKSREIRSYVNCFWKERIPKEKMLSQLFYQLEPFKNNILTAYRTLLLGNDTILTAVPEKDSILSYVEALIPTEENEPEPVVLSVPVNEAVAVTGEEIAKPETLKCQTPVFSPVTVSPQPVKTIRVKQQCISDTECRGFREKNSITRKKAVTCAVCVAAAGALLIPLVAYAIVKHKSE